VGVIGGFRSVTHSVSWAVWACACHPLTSYIAHAPPAPSPPDRVRGRLSVGGGMLEGQGTHGTPGRTKTFDIVRLNVLFFLSV